MVLLAILHEGRILGFFILAPFTVVAHDRDDLVRIFGVQRDEGDVIHPIDGGEILRLLFG